MLRSEVSHLPADIKKCVYIVKLSLKITRKLPWITTTKTFYTDIKRDNILEFTSQLARQIYILYKAHLTQKGRKINPYEVTESKNVPSFLISAQDGGD